MKPKIIPGGNHKDHRGELCFNNTFNAREIKRIYTIENRDPEFIRAWQGHLTEKRWFSAIQGSFEIKLIQIDNWEKPSKILKPISFKLSGPQMDILCVPPGYISSIQALEPHAKLLVMSDYLLGEINDEYRYDKDYFK